MRYLAICFNSSVCVKMKCGDPNQCLSTVYQLSMLLFNYDTEILTLHRIDLSILLSVKYSYACFIYAEIFEKMSSGGLEVSFSILLFKSGGSREVLTRLSLYMLQLTLLYMYRQL